MDAWVSARDVYSKKRTSITINAALDDRITFTFLIYMRPYPPSFVFIKEQNTEVTS